MRHSPNQAADRATIEADDSRDTDIVDQLRALADGIEAGEFDIHEASGLRMKVGEDSLRVRGVWLE